MANESYTCDGCEMIYSGSEPKGRHCPGHGPDPRLEDFEQYVAMQRLNAQMYPDELVAKALGMMEYKVRAIRLMLPGMRQLFEVKA